jgi:hypothetical protein
MMATAAHYRKLAEECFEWAHEARDVSVRQHYAKLCQIWLECAAAADLRAGVIRPSAPQKVQKVRAFGVVDDLQTAAKAASAYRPPGKR